MLMIKPCESLEIVKYVIYQREILEKALEDGGSVDKFAPLALSQGIFLQYEENNELCGVIHLLPKSSVCVEMHFYVMPPKKDCKYRMMREFLEYFVKFDDALKLNVVIPVCYPTIIHCIEKSGFKAEGVDRKCFKKNGELHDRQLFGLTKDEIKEILA